MPAAHSIPAVLTPFVTLGRELQDIVDERAPMLGGCVGSLALGAAFLAMLVTGSPAGAEAPASAFELTFTPGALTRLGAEPQPIPQKSIHEATHASGETPTATVSDTSDTSVAEPSSAEPSQTPQTNDHGKPSDRDRSDTNPYHEANNDADPVGDPLGDAQGWADAYAAGDAWATGVMKALAGMKVPGYAGKLPQGQSFGFKLEVCKSGTIGKVLVKQSTGVAELDAAIKYELARLAIPKPPPHIAAKMPTSCVMLKYQFAWSPGSIR